MNDLISTYGGVLILGSNIADLPEHFFGRHAWKPVLISLRNIPRPGVAPSPRNGGFYRSSDAKRATRACLWQNVFQIRMS